MAELRRLRVGLVGGGLVGQAEHAFFLWEQRDRFDFVGLADPSASVRSALGERFGIPNVYGDAQDLFASGLDAAVIAAPDAYHPQLATAALDAGLNVLCEKPLSLTVEGCDAIGAARDRAGRILQVAYMKRFDPAYRRALQMLPARIDDIKLISIEVSDPDQDPFVAHLPMTVPSDLPRELRQDARARTAEQLRQGAGRRLDEEGARAFANGFLSALVHNVSMAHGILLRFGQELPPTADYGGFFDEGRGVQLGFGLPGGGRVSMTHLNLPGVPDYRERVTVYCTDRIIELAFPAPYLRNVPTRLTVSRGGEGRSLHCEEVRVSFEDAFREELCSFHAAVCGEAPVVTTVEQARRDIELLTSAFRLAVAS